MIYKRPVQGCSSSFSPSTPLTPRFSRKATRKWVLPCPSLVGSAPSPHQMYPRPRVSLKNSLTRSLSTSQTIPSLFAVAPRLRGLSCHRVAVISSVESYSDLITFQPGRPPSPIHRPALPHVPAKCVSTSRPTHRHSSQSTCRTFPTSTISP